MRNENSLPDEDGIQIEFWNKIEQIEDISVPVGLERVSGQKGVYESSLKLLVKEIEKCDKNLRDFLAASDMHNFTVEVHSMKSSLANTGANELSVLARELEFASDRGDAAYCSKNLFPFLERLGSLNSRLAQAFAKKGESYGPIEIPPELPPVFKRLTVAFGDMDFLAVEAEIKKLDALNYRGALKEEIEVIKDAVMMTDYESAAELIRKLLNAPDCG